MLKLVFQILESTPGKLQREISTLSPREMKTRPAPGKWSVQEVLAHLEDIEGVGMRARVAAMIEQENPLLPAIDQEARAVTGRYNRRDPRRSLASFTRQRRANLKWLRRLRAAQFKRKGLHATVGEISVEELVHEWAFHDLGHLKQILEIKRYGLFPRMGNMKAFYHLS
jgi:CelD/BcsL family acetyltransferase involved in cellulose biosynthesis